MDLRAHIEGPGPIADIRSYLLNLNPAERWGQLLTLKKRHQRTLYLKAEGSDPMALADVVPGEAPAMASVVHSGKNSLMMFRDFEKCFARDENGQIFGYNEGSLRSLIGPGYFLLRETHGDAEIERAALVVDYFDVPSGAVPGGWPEIKPNSSGLQYFVYHKTRDYLRAVCPGVCVGSAYKTWLGKERKLDTYFLLMRAGSGAHSDG